MQIAYLVFAYKNPQLLKRLIETLSSEDCAFFIHIDKKSDLDDFALINGDNIFFTDERIPVYWAEFSGVQAILILIRQAFKASQQYDYFVLLSGSEYPLKSRKYIHDFFASNYGMEFMNIVKMPSQEASKPISRIKTVRIQSHRPVLRFFMRVLARLHLATRDYRKHLGSLEPYSGNAWWALTRDACRYVLEFSAHHRAVIQYFENTFAPEEMFFHTVLGNSVFKSRMRRNLVYEDWSARGSHPEMISEKHIALFEANAEVNVDDVYGFGEVLFARKFSDDNLELVNRINDIIKENEGMSRLKDGPC